MNYAEQVNYFKTSKSSVDTWITKTLGLIESVGGDVESHAVLNHKQGSGIFIQFRLGDDIHEIKFPVLPCETDTQANQQAAKVQAATALYHSVKEKVVLAKFMGLRVAFGHYLKLEDGTTIEDKLKNDGPADFVLMLPGGKNY